MAPCALVGQADVSLLHLTVEDGLAGQRTYHALLDSKGYMWFATNNGLSRYDGQAFRNFRHVEGDSTSLGNNLVYDVFEDETGIFWIGTNNGLDRFDPVTETFTHFRHDPNDPNSLSNDRVRHIGSDRNGKIWLSTLGGGINRFDKEKGKFYAYHLVDPKQTDNNNNAYYVNTLGEFAEDITAPHILWLPTTNNGIVKLDQQERQVNLIPFPEWLPKTSTHAIFTEKPDRLWVGTWGAGLARYSISAQRWTFFYPFPELKADGASRGIANIILDIKPKDRETLWLASKNEGLVAFNRRTKTFSFPAPHGVKSEGLYLDPHDRLWVLTDRGVYMRPSDDPPVDQITFESGGSSLQPLDIMELDDGETLVSLYAQDEVYLLGADQRRKGAIPVRPPAERISVIAGLLQDSGDDIWAVDFENKRLLRLDQVAGAFRPFRKDLLDQLPVQRFRMTSVLEDQQHNLWITTYGGGLLKMPPARDTLIQLVHQDGDDDKIQAGLFFYDRYYDSRGLLWLASGDRGLYVFDPRTEKVVRRYHEQGQGALQIKDNFLESITEDKQGRIWIGFKSKGIQIIDPTGREPARQLTAADGLPSETIPAMAPDARGNIWILTAAGLCCYRWATQSLDQVNERYGMIHRFSEWENNIKLLRSGKLAYFLNDRAYLFHPDSLPVNNEPPPVVLTGFKVFETEKQFGQSIDYLQEIRLAAHENFFTFSFAALNFEQPERNRFTYRLEGFDRDWIHSGNRNFAGYTNVPPGRYTFHVKAANNDGVWNETGAAVDIIIAPPWHRTGWAYAGYGLALLALGYGWWWLQRRRWEERTQLQLQEAEARRLRELDEAKTRLYTNITHEFRTPLTVILGLITELQQKFKGPVADQLRVVRRNGEQLFQLINQLLDIARIEAGRLQLELVQSNVISFLSYLTESFHSLAKRKHIRLTFTTAEEAIWMDYDPKRLQQVVSNLLSNALKFTPEYGAVSVVVRQPRPDQLEIEVSDTGPGIPADQIDRIFDRFYQVDAAATRKAEGTGIGLALARELVEMMNGSIAVQSTPGQETTFAVVLPITQEAPVEKTEKDPPEAPAREKGSLVAPLPAAEEPGASPRELPLLLIVEDNADVRYYLRTTLAESHRIEEADNGKAGLEKALELVPDIIISDVMMPEMDGFELCEKLKKDERTSHIPIILLTARATAQDRLTGLRTGADAYLAKPFSREELDIRLAQLVALRRKLRERFSGGLLPDLEAVSPEDPEAAFLKKLNQTIAAHLSEENFGVTDLSRALAMSRMQLHRKITALTGRSTSEYLKAARLHRGRELLRGTNLRVGEVAARVGFKDHSHFSRAYRQLFGKAPSEE